MNPQRAARRGASEVIATILMLAITLVVGAGVFGYVNQQAGVSALQYGSSAGATVNYLQERFTPVMISFNYPTGCTSPCTSTSITLFIYNNGNIVNHFQQVEVYNTTRSKIDLTFNSTYVANVNSGCKVAAATFESPLLGTGPSAYSVNMGGISSITLSIPTSCYTGNFHQGDTYYVTVLGQYGNIVTYFQVM